MKKAFFLVMALCMMAVTAKAQSSYLRLGVGGGIGLKMYNGYFWINENETNSADNIEVKSMGLGGGLNASLAFGHMFSDYVGLELAVNEFIGLNKKTTYEYDGTYGNMSSEIKISGMMLQLIPALVITPGLEKTNPYARLGMIVGILPSVTEKYTQTATSDGGYKATTTSEEKMKLSGGVAMGFTAAAGVGINLSEKFSFFGELVFNGITYAPKKGEIKEWTVDGVDQLPDATTNEKEWTFEKEFDADDEIPDSQPDIQPKMSMEFSNVEINIGLIFKL